MDSDKQNKLTPESSVICFDIAGNAPAASEEKFPEALAPELKLNEWVFWEHYENIGQQKDTRDQNYLANQKKVAWFNDVISFWQVWNNLPISDVANFYYNITTNTIPTYEVKDNSMRISTLSMFLNGVSPQWEDPVNALGGEYQLRFAFSDDQPCLEKLNKIWENLVLDLIAQKFPHSDAIVGVRLVDKSFSGKENFRMEVWVKYDNESSEVANQIKEFIAEHYNTENAQPQAVSFRSHK